MTVSVRSIETAVPTTVLKQSEISDIFAGQPGITRLGRRLISAVYDVSAIDTRHTVIGELESGSTDGTVEPSSTTQGPARFCPRPPGAQPGLHPSAHPSCSWRRPAGRCAARGIAAADITHVITVSCTGFYAPGPDYALVRGLGLRPSTQRFHLGFMGCYGAFPALRAARHSAEADPEAVVLVVASNCAPSTCASSNDPDRSSRPPCSPTGPAAAIVTRPRGRGRHAGARPRRLRDASSPPRARPTWRGRSATTASRCGCAPMCRTIIGASTSRAAVAPLLAAAPRSRDPSDVIERWAIHPGGRSILDKVQASLALSDEQLAPSREVLRTTATCRARPSSSCCGSLLHGEAAARRAGLARWRSAPASPSRPRCSPSGAGSDSASRLSRRDLRHRGVAGRS